MRAMVEKRMLMIYGVGLGRVIELIGLMKVIVWLTLDEEEG